MPGVVFSKEQKKYLTKKFDSFGVDIIGLMPAISYSERELATELVDCGLGGKLIAATMMRKDHIDIAKSCGMENIILFTSLSDIHLDKKLKITRKENLENAVKYVDYAKSQGFQVFFAGEDATRADFSYLIDFMNKLDVGYFLPCDTLGVLTPYQTYNWIKKIKSECDLKIGLHIHNDFGCATANSLSGIMAGADLVSGTFTGIGERAGNAPLEEIILSLKYQYGVDLDVNYYELSKICSLVEKYSGVRLQKHKPIIGENAFAHESGIHVDGILKDPLNYEIMNPSLIGREREIIFGKHSGTAGLKYLFGDKFNSKEYGEMLQKIKDLSESEGRCFSSEEILNMF